MKEMSHPTWVRGLKFPSGGVGVVDLSVAPHVGAWIEIMISHRSYTTGWVAPHVGAWIEMEYGPRTLRPH